MSSVLKLSTLLNDELHGRLVIEPGLHAGVSFADYLRIDAASNSRFTALERSPAHLYAEMTEPSEGTEATILGTQAHCLILQPDLFNRTHREGPAGNWTRKAQKDEVEALRAEGFDVLKPDTWHDLHRMRDTVLAHPAAALALQGDDYARELTGVWRDERTGMLCKLRIDHLATHLNATVELKSTLDAREDEFSKSVYNYRYYRQAAWYLTGMRVLAPGVDWKHHIIVAAEKENPWAVNTFRLRDDAIEAGCMEIFGDGDKPGLLHKYAECVRSNEWPAYSTDFNEISLPPWAWKQIDERVEKIA